MRQFVASRISFPAPPLQGDVAEVGRAVERARGRPALGAALLRELLPVPLFGDRAAEPARAPPLLDVRLTA